LNHQLLLCLTDFLKLSFKYILTTDFLCLSNAFLADSFRDYSPSELTSFALLIY